MIQEEQLEPVIESLEELNDDSSVPKNIKIRIGETIKTLKENDEISIRVHKALNLLEEVAEDTNLKSYTRTQIWNIVSLLEKF